MLQFSQQGIVIRCAIVSPNVHVGNKRIQGSAGYGRHSI